MKFSVIVPIYNVEKYINQCVLSIINQSYKDFELILVNDGSTDRSGIICDEFSHQNEFISVIHKSNEGQLSARRIGLKKSIGEYCVFCDSDDFMENDALEKINDIIDENDPDLVIYNAYLYDGINKDIFTDHPFEKGFISNKQRIYKKLLTSYSIDSLCMKAIKRKIIDVNKDYTPFYDCPFGEDKLQTTPIIIKANKIYYLPERLYNYRYNSGMMRKFNSKYYDSFKRVNQEITNLLEEENISELNNYSAFNLLIAAYGGTTQFKYKDDYNKNDFSIIAEDESFINAYNLIKGTTLKNELSIKQKIILSLLYYRMYGLIKIILKK